MKHSCIHWFRKGLRLHDNPALLAAMKDCSELYPIFILDPWFPKNMQVSVNRWRFLVESLKDLDESLKKLNSRQVQSEQVSMQASCPQAGSGVKHGNTLGLIFASLSCRTLSAFRESCGLTSLGLIHAGIMLHWIRSQSNSLEPEAPIDLSARCLRGPLIPQERVTVEMQVPACNTPSHLGVPWSALGAI